MSSTAESSSQASKKPSPSPSDVRAAAHALAHCLGENIYAIVGGGALTLLGSERETDDVDFVVPKGKTKETRLLLKGEPAYFDVEPKTLHTYYKSTPPVGIEILAPPTLFQMPFDSETPIILIDGVKVLKPTFVLNAKCGSILGRSNYVKKLSDSYDVKYLLRWCISDQGRSHGCIPTAFEVPAATKEFVEWFIGTYQERDLWQRAGYDFTTGRFPSEV